MTLNIGKRDKAFLFGGGIFVACYLLFFLVVEPIYKKQIRIDKKIKDKINFIEKYYEVINQASYYQAKKAANKNTNTNLQKRFFSEKEPGLAAASLQRLLQGFSRGAVTIEKTRVEKPKYMARILAVPVEITVRSSLKNLALFLMRIENHEKFLVIEELRSRRINKKEPEDLQTRLLITGFTKELEPKGGKQT
jgi:hypothetical protein